MRRPSITRDDALEARPLQVPPVATKEKGPKLYVTVEYQRPLWQRLLGSGERCRREYGLDAYGREVYDACDGRTSVKKIVRRFAKHHRISSGEAEKAVTTFLKTLMSRGLVAMEMDTQEMKA